MFLFSLNSKSSLRTALLSRGITGLTDTQVRILTEGRTHYNSLVQGRPNDGQTLGLVILMLQLIDATKNSTQGILVTATRGAAIRTFKEANKLAEDMGQGIRFGLVLFDESDTPTKGQFHCIIGTPQAMVKCIVGDWFSLRMIYFDDANKSMSFNNGLLSHGAKYVCSSAYISKKLADCCNNELQAIQLKNTMNTIMSKNLRHIQFVCESQSQKLDACIELCKWPNAKQIIIFVSVK